MIVTYWWCIDIGSDKGLVPSGNEPLPLPELMLTQVVIIGGRYRGVCDNTCCNRQSNCLLRVILIVTGGGGWVGGGGVGVGGGGGGWGGGGG